MTAGWKAPFPSFSVVGKQPALVSPMHGGNPDIMRKMAAPILYA
jgi:isocitrate/isopropylmalate dehydrogenase